MVYTNSIFSSIQTDLITFIAGKMITGVLGTDATTEQSSDTTLGAQVFSSPIDEIDDQSQLDSVIGTLAVGTGEANSNALTEFGILDMLNGMILRETFTTINKTVDISLSFDGTVGFTLDEVFA